MGEKAQSTLCTAMVRALPGIPGSRDWGDAYYLTEAPTALCMEGPQPCRARVDAVHATGGGDFVPDRCIAGTLRPASAVQARLPGAAVDAGGSSD